MKRAKRRASSALGNHQEEQPPPKYELLENKKREAVHSLAKSPYLLAFLPHDYRSRFEKFGPLVPIAVIVVTAPCPSLESFEEPFYRRNRILGATAEASLGFIHETSPHPL
jgi:hypothetical protein